MAAELTQRTRLAQAICRKLIVIAMFNNAHKHFGFAYNLAYFLKLLFLQAES